MELLSLLLCIPLVLSVFFMIAPQASGEGLRRLAIIGAIIPLVLLLANHNGWIGSEISHTWFTKLPIHFNLGVDALSLVFLYLTALVVLFSLIAVRTEINTSPRTFFSLVFLLEALLFAFFTSKDLVFFTIFWEAMLLPLYFIINIWGASGREGAAMKFLLYMIAGSALMVLAVLGVYFTGAKSFDIEEIGATASASAYAPWLCGIFLLAFAVKTPLFPFHGWLPDAYTQAPTSGTILLSGILSKAGIYGILRVGMEFFPEILREWSPLLLGLSIAGVFYAGLAAWMQNDYKRLIAYSSFAHVNFILVGMFVWNEMARTGTILQAFNHGVTITALFLVAGWLEKRLGKTSMAQAGGLAKFMPHLCWLTLFFVLSSVALPGTNTFIGEFLILLGMFFHNPWVAGILSLTVVLSVIYMLRFMQKVYFEEPTFFQESWVDIGPKQFLIAAPLIALILWVGLFPSPFFDLIRPATVKSLSMENKP